MKMKTNKKVALLALMIAACIVTSCEEVKYVDKIVYAEDYNTIYAFGYEVLVTADQSISMDDFIKARIKLQKGMNNAYKAYGDVFVIRNAFDEVLGRDGFIITIKNDNSSTDRGDSNLEMTIGVKYLLETSDDYIYDNILLAVWPVSLFSKANTSDIIRMAKAPSESFAKQVVAQLPQSRAAIQQRA